MHPLKSENAALLTSFYITETNLDSYQAKDCKVFSIQKKNSLLSVVCMLNVRNTVWSVALVKKCTAFLSTKVQNCIEN